MRSTPERIVGQRHEDAPHQVDDRDARRGLDLGHPWPGAPSGSSRVEHAPVALEEGRDVALVPHVIAGGDDVGPGTEDSAAVGAVRPAPPRRSRR
jgi:hypothetical protein